MSPQPTFSMAVLTMHISRIRGFAEQLERAQRWPDSDPQLIAGLADCLLSEASGLADKLRELGLDNASSEDVAG